MGAVSYNDTALCHSPANSMFNCSIRWDAAPRQPRELVREDLLKNKDVMGDTVAETVSRPFPLPLYP